MDFVDDPLERVTAVTDLVVGIMAIGAMLSLGRFRQQYRWKATIWMWVFGLLATAALLGAVVHGIRILESPGTMLWYPLYLSLDMLVALFIVAVVHDTGGQAVSRRLLPLSLAIAIGVFWVTLPGDNFLVFIVYEVLSMIFALLGYAWLGIRYRVAGAGIMSAGILVTIIAALAQADESLNFSLVWSFDHNGIYHLIQMMGIVLLAKGLRRQMRCGT